MVPMPVKWLLIMSAMRSSSLRSVVRVFRRSVKRQRVLNAKAKGARAQALSAVQIIVAQPTAAQQANGALRAKAPQLLANASHGVKAVAGRVVRVS